MDNSIHRRVVRALLEPDHSGHLTCTLWLAEQSSPVRLELGDVRLASSSLWIEPETPPGAAAGPGDQDRRPEAAATPGLSTSFSVRLQPRALLPVTPGQAGREEKLDSREEARIDAVLAQIERIEKLKNEVEQCGHPPIVRGPERAVSLDQEEWFWKGVLEFESSPTVRIGDLLTSAGVQSPPPDTLSDPALTRELIRMVAALAQAGILLVHTNHLSDRELYTLLHDRVLDEVTQQLPTNTGWRCHLSLSEFGVPGDEDGLQTFLRYYADLEFREQWAKDFPDDPMPPREDPPYDRDRWLPGAFPG